VVHSIEKPAMSYVLPNFGAEAATSTDRASSAAAIRTTSLVHTGWDGGDEGERSQENTQPPT
jgi:hypothetical protein